MENGGGSQLFEPPKRGVMRKKGSAKERVT